MKIVVFIVIIAIIGISAGIFIQRLSSGPSQPSSISVTGIVSDQITARLSIDTQDQPLITYTDIIVNANETFAEMIDQVVREQRWSIVFTEQGVISSIGEWQNDETRRWQVYLNGLLVTENLFEKRLSAGDYIELQFEQISIQDVDVEVVE